MVRKKKEPNRVDEMLDELLEDCQTPEDILGESGLLKQLSKRLIERALAGELNHHLKGEKEIERDESNAESQPRSNSRNGYSKKTIQSNHGEMSWQSPAIARANLNPSWYPSTNAA
jgi:transposase-like protein